MGKAILCRCGSVGLIHSFILILMILVNPQHCVSMFYNISLWSLIYSIFCTHAWLFGNENGVFWHYTREHNCIVAQTHSCQEASSEKMERRQAADLRWKKDMQKIVRNSWRPKKLINRALNRALFHLFKQRDCIKAHCTLDLLSEVERELTWSETAGCGEAKTCLNSKQSTQTPSDREDNSHPGMIRSYYHTYCST